MSFNLNMHVIEHLREESEFRGNPVLWVIGFLCYKLLDAMFADDDDDDGSNDPGPGTRARPSKEAGTIFMPL